MMDKRIEIRYEEFESADELKADEKLLLEKAKSASEGAYAPYSSFYVGAALVLENGEIIIGNNQENAAYSTGLCAERVAFFAAMANHPNAKILKCAIYAKSKNISVETPVAPCGACRQAMSEYEQKQKSAIALILAGEKGNIIRLKGVHEILPLRFGPDALGKG